MGREAGLSCGVCGGWAPVCVAPHRREYLALRLGFYDGLLIRSSMRPLIMAPGVWRHLVVLPSSLLLVTGSRGGGLAPWGIQVGGAGQVMDCVSLIRKVQSHWYKAPGSPCPYSPACVRYPLHSAHKTSGSTLAPQVSPHPFLHSPTQTPITPVSVLSCPIRLSYIQPRLRRG